MGGGSPETELSDIALLWMAAKIQSATDLAIDIEKLNREAKPDPLGPLHPPEAGWRYALGSRIPYLRLVQQDIRGIPDRRRGVFKTWRTSKLRNGSISLNETVDESALTRLGQTIREKYRGKFEERIYEPSTLKALFSPEPQTADSVEA